MGDPIADVLTPVDQARCPSCAAALRPGAPWCTLCYADLRPAPSPGVPPVTAVPAQVLGSSGTLDPLTAPASAFGLPDRSRAGEPAPPAPEATWPCVACGCANALSQDTCTACGAGFLAGLRASEGPLLELPVVGDLAALSRGQRLGLAAGVVLALLALIALLGVLSG